MRIDEHTWELLSRHLDGDLSAEEADALESRLAAEPELARELASLRERQAVLRQAAEEEPPAVLDELMEPLRRSRPVARRVRPALAWLAAAATLVLGVTVGVEVFHRSPAPELGKTFQRSRVAPSPYLLQPLPGGAEDSQPEGALERLLASPVPAPTVGPLTPVPPEGPTDVAPSAAKEAPQQAARKRELREAQSQSVHGLLDKEQDAVGGGEEKVRREARGGRAEPAPAPSDEVSAAAPARGRATLSLAAGATPLEVHLPADSVLLPGRYPVEVTVDPAGVIVAATPRLPGGTSPPDGLVAGCRRLVGAHLAGLTPGRHAATLVVDRGPATPAR